MDVHKWIECALLINVPITIFESCRYQLAKSHFFLHPAQLISNNVGYLSAEVAKIQHGFTGLSHLLLGQCVQPRIVCLVAAAA